MERTPAKTVREVLAKCRHYHRNLWVGNLYMEEVVLLRQDGATAPVGYRHMLLNAEHMLAAGQTFSENFYFYLGQTKP